MFYYFYLSYFLRFVCITFGLLFRVFFIYLLPGILEFWCLVTVIFMLNVLYKNICNPVDTRRRFNIDTTSYDVVQRRIDFETTCVYGEINWEI